MQKLIDKLTDALKQSQVASKDLAAVTMPRGLGRVHKNFWTKIYPLLQEYLIEMIKYVENISKDEIPLPTDDETFLLLWKDYKETYFDEAAKYLSIPRQRTQLDLLMQYSENDIELASKMLRHFINRADTHIYKVNFKQAEKTDNENLEYHE